jgi:hypothetical protein
LNRRRMGQFHRFINDASLQEIHLNRRLFTVMGGLIPP